MKSLSHILGWGGGRCESQSWLIQAALKNRKWLHKTGKSFCHSTSIHFGIWPIFIIWVQCLLAKSRVKPFLPSLLSAAFLLVPQTPRNKNRSNKESLSWREAAWLLNYFSETNVPKLSNNGDEEQRQRASSDSVHPFNTITRRFFCQLIVSWYRWAHRFLHPTSEGVMAQSPPPVDMRKFPVAAVDSQRLDSNCGPGTTQVDIKTFIKKKK